MTEDRSGHVKIGLDDIYRELRELGRVTRATRQSVDEVVKPSLASAHSEIRRLDTTKADDKDLTEAKARVTSLELRVYAILAGLIAAFTIGKGIGLL